MSSAITPIIMPKWGLEMREGTIADWLVDVGTQIIVGMPIMDVETDKLSNSVEAFGLNCTQRSKFSQSCRKLESFMIAQI